MQTSCFIGFGIADSKTNHGGGVEVHLGNALEIVGLGVAKSALCSGHRCTRHHIDEAVRNLVNIANAFLWSLGGDEEHIV